MTKTSKRPGDPAEAAITEASGAGARADAIATRAEAPPASAPRTYKAAILRRATHYEAELIELALAVSSAKYRDLFLDVLYLDHSDPRFAVLRNAFIDAFGEPRADELLAPSDW